MGTYEALRQRMNRWNPIDWGMPRAEHERPYVQHLEYHMYPPGRVRTIAGTGPDKK